MKHIGNLPANLRAFFGALRICVLVLALFWFFNLTFNAWVQKRFADHPRLVVTLGELWASPAGGNIALDASGARAGSLAVHALRGTLQLDLLAGDPTLTAAVRWTMIPSMAVFLGFTWWLLGALRNLCANVARGEVFCADNLRLVRGIGAILIVYALAGLGVEFWSAHVMGHYLNQHVTGASLPAFAPGAGALRFTPTAGAFSNWGSFVTGAVVLMLSEAFRQGLALKSENDLTV